MTKEIIYTYLGTNGILKTSIHLENIPCMKSFILKAEEGFKLTKDNKTFTSIIQIPEEELNEWYEIPNEGQI